MTNDTLRLACELALAARRRADKRRRRARPRGAPEDAPVRRSPMQRRGDLHEDAALRLLLAQGLVLLARNLWTRAGEIDLAMRDGDTLVFVEVRARGQPATAAPRPASAATSRPGWPAPPRNGCRN